jgi:hypothetical protein
MMAVPVKIGDYVLATRWPDGDPCDPFAVGFVSKIDEDHFDIVDANGGHIKNGLRRAEVITQDEGDALVAMFSHISDLPGDSLWTHLARLRGQLIASSVIVNNSRRNDSDGHQKTN